MNVPPQLAEVLAQIDLLLLRWQAALPLAPGLRQQLRLDVEVTHTYHSNAIEGNTLTLGETKAILLDGITISGKPLREHLETVNHREALRLMIHLASTTTPIIEDEILALHRCILTGIQSEDAGRYRTMRVRVAGPAYIFPNPAKVPALMQQLLNETNTSKDHPVIKAAHLHQRFVAIHPFADGNGRTVRLLMNLLLLRHGFPPTLVPLSVRPRYYDSLEAADFGDSSDFILLIAELVAQSLGQVLEVIE
jgi:Fic family protein